VHDEQSLKQTDKLQNRSFVTIKNSREFRSVFDTAVSVANRYLVVYAAVRKTKNGKENNRYGITVSRKVGKAVVRNKVRRRIREIMRFHTKSEKSVVLFGVDIVVVARAAAAAATFDELREAYGRALQKSVKQSIRAEV